MVTTKEISVRSENFLTCFLTLLMPFHCALFLTSQHPPALKSLLLLVWHNSKCSEKEKLIAVINHSSACFKLITHDMLLHPNSKLSWHKSTQLRLYADSWKQNFTTDSNVLSTRFTCDHHILCKDILPEAVKKCEMNILNWLAE